MELVVPLANNLIMLKRSLWSCRHLKHQVLSAGDDFFQSSGIIFLLQFLAIRGAVAPLANDPIILWRLTQLFKHLEHENPSINSYLQAEQDGATILEESDCRSRIRSEEYSWLRGCNNQPNLNREN